MFGGVVLLAFVYYVVYARKVYDGTGVYVHAQYYIETGDVPFKHMIQRYNIQRLEPFPSIDIIDIKR